MIHRYLNILKLLDKNASAFLFGARGTGKSYLANEFMQSRNDKNIATLSINLLESETYEKYLKHPDLFRKEITKLTTQKEKCISIYVDEIQRVPALLNEIHALIETHPRKLQFLLTGSSARKLKRSSTNMLAGRALSLRLHPFTMDEWDCELSHRLQYGSLPSMAYKFCDDTEVLKGSLRSYVSTYLKEEIQQEALVRRLDAFARFLEIAGQFHAKVMNTAEIAKAAGVSAHTIGEYVQILEDTLIVTKLPGWNASAKKQLRTTPKIYFFDNGVVNAIRGELNVPIRESTGRYGELFKGTIVQELVRANDYHQLDLKLSYWRTNNDMEVDLILSRGAGKPIAAIEIKSSINPARKDLHGLEAFKTDHPNVPQYCICRADRAFTTDQGVEIIPYGKASALIRKIAEV